MLRCQKRHFLAKNLTGESLRILSNALLVANSSSNLHHLLNLSILVADMADEEQPQQELPPQPLDSSSPTLRLRSWNNLVSQKQQSWRKKRLTKLKQHQQRKHQQRTSMQSHRPIQIISQR